MKFLTRSLLQSPFSSFLGPDLQIIIILIIIIMIMMMIMIIIITITIIVITTIIIIKFKELNLWLTAPKGTTPVN